MKKIILFPGSFNPITNGHVKMAEAAMKRVDADEVWFIPANNEWIERKHCYIIDGYDRVALINKTGKELGMPFYGLYTELHEKTYTFLTIEKLKVFFDYDFYILMGEDAAATIPAWEEASDLIADNKFILVKRSYSPQMEVPLAVQLYSKKCVYIDNLDILKYSSTKVRELTKRGKFKKMKKYAPKAVVKYMKKIRKDV